MQEIREMISEQVKKIVSEDAVLIDDSTQLLGSSGILDSMKLVHLCLSLEDRANDLGFEFNWTSDSALSNVRSMFRTVGSLADEFTRQMENKK